MVDRLLDLGLRTFVLPHRELARAGKAGKILFKYMLRSVLYSKPETEVLIYGKPS